MKDRIVEHPKRFRLVKVEDQLDQYDLISAPGEITEIGTPVNKATLLRDSTLSKYTNTESTKNIAETPDGVFQALARANATSIVTILADSIPFYATYENQGNDVKASFNDILHDATGKCTQDKVYIPKGIKKVCITASFYFYITGGSYSIDICKNGSPVQSIDLKTSQFAERGLEVVEYVVDTSGSGSEYLQINFRGDGVGINKIISLSCNYAVFQMLTY